MTFEGLRNAMQAVYAACAVRGLFCEDTFKKIEVVSEVAASGIDNDQLRIFAKCLAAYGSGAVVSAIEGAKAFSGDAKRLVEWLREESERRGITVEDRDQFTGKPCPKQ